MYDWYAKAAKCYVYLSDVFPGPNLYDYEKGSAQPFWTPQFVRSKWFTRGRTLLELIAPSKVEFFSRDGRLLGDKDSLRETIHHITRIPMDVLSLLKRPEEYSVSKRMTWAEHRSTTRIEDKAYSLLGLFGINMPIIYGEGEKAFQRLQREITELTNQTSGLRLLVVGASPLAIETFARQDEPEYAILSHTWGINEVSYQDVILGRAVYRSGYRKIKSCCDLAARKGFKYLWADTCCIDKTSSAELQEAICSMYRWYKNADVCFVYLEDYVPSRTDLSRCRWFTRGWTLQELIAPSSVEFYDSQWNEIGTKSRLCLEIADITGIDPPILRGDDPMERTVAERMSWASTRSTTRIEDEAYCLMGLFDVFMPMLYGEGEQAFIRLQEAIIRQSEDLTIFAWKSAGQYSYDAGIFAPSPSSFNRNTYPGVQTSKTLGISRYWTDNLRLHSPATLTSRGLFISLPLWPRTGFDGSAMDLYDLAKRAFSLSDSFRVSGQSSELSAGAYLALSCRVQSSTMEGEPDPQILCIALRSYLNGGVFVRVSSGDVFLLPEKNARNFKIHTIYVYASPHVTKLFEVDD